MRHGSTRLGLTVILAMVGVSAFAGDDDEPPLPDSRLGHRTTPLLLLSRPDVRADLELTADQTESARRAIRNFYVQAMPLRGKPNTPETIRERRVVDDAAFGWIDSRLTPEQKLRLVQIDLQWEGPSALLSRSALTRDLHLSVEQIATLKRAIGRRDELRAEGRAEGRPDPGRDGPRLPGQRPASSVAGHARPAIVRGKGRQPRRDQGRTLRGGADRQAVGSLSATTRSNSASPRIGSKSDSDAICSRRSGSRSRASASARRALAESPARLQ